MIWISLMLVLSVVFAVLFIKLVSKVISKFDIFQSDGSVLDMIMDYPKTCAVVLLVFILGGQYLVKYQIGQMYTCSVRSSVQQVETQYSWYFDSCQFKNKSGVWIDFKQVRGNPEGDDGDTQ